MRREELAPREHVAILAKELDRMHESTYYQECQTMGELTALHISKELSIDIDDTSDDPSI